MKYKGNGLIPPKNFRSVIRKISCGTCKYYDWYSERQFTTCKRCRGANKAVSQIWVNYLNRYNYVCDGWKKVEEMEI